MFTIGIGPSFPKVSIATYQSRLSLALDHAAYAGKAWDNSKFGGNIQSLYPPSGVQAKHPVLSTENVAIKNWNATFS